MLDWKENDEPAKPAEPERNDTLQLTATSRVHIIYGRYAMVWLSVDPRECRKLLDADNRDGTRCKVLRELLPLAEAALVALRDAVAELPPEQTACQMCGKLFTQGDDRIPLCPACYEEGRQEQAREYAMEHDPRLIAGRHVAEHEPPIDMADFANGLLGGKPREVFDVEGGD